MVVTDLGFAKRARTFAELIDAPLAIIEKRRTDNDDRAEVLNVIGEVRGKRAIIVDDEIDTAGTLMEIDQRAGARGRDRDVRLRHPRRPVRSGHRAHRRLEPDRGGHHGHHPAAARASASSSIKQLTVAPLIGEAIRRIHGGESVGALFSSEIKLVQEMVLWSEDEPADHDGRP